MILNKALGIDIGGTEIKVGIVTDLGEILESSAIRTGKEKDEIIKTLKEVINSYLEKHEVLGVGIGSAGSIDTVKGAVTEISGNIQDWAFTPLRDILEYEFPGIKFYFDNDANIALIAEKWIGAAKNHKNVLMLTLGTGLGGAIYIENCGIYRGSHFKGAEIGHAILYPKGRSCQCGQFGCAEKYISGVGIENNYFELTGVNLKGKEIIERYFSDNNSKEAIEFFTEDLAIFSISVKNILDIDCIVVGGGVINSKEIWWNSYLDKFKNKVNSEDNITIVPAEFSNTSGIIGAAKLVFNGEG